MYDGADATANCSIETSNEGKTCSVSFNMTGKVDGPLYVYYELTNLFQNHRRFYESRSIAQLQGDLLSASEVELNCDPLYMNGTNLLNPCGLTANTFFNGMIYSFVSLHINYLSLLYRCHNSQRRNVRSARNING